MQTIRFWSGSDQPYHKDSDVQQYESRQWGGNCVFNVTEPMLCLPQGENVCVDVVVLAGGGYTTESLQRLCA